MQILKKRSQTILATSKQITDFAHGFIDITVVTYKTKKIQKEGDNLTM